MAKIRVYELAKELGLDNKEILAKLRSLKIPVKSHMSVVPEEKLDEVKKSLTEKDEVNSGGGGGGGGGGVEEKRVASGVIRRRAKTTKAEAEEDTAEKEAEKKARLDIESLKQTARKGRREEAESAKPEMELEEIPKEWEEVEEEEEAPAKKSAKKKKTAKKAAEKPKKKAPSKEKETEKQAEPEEEQEPEELTAPEEAPHAPEEPAAPEPVEEKPEEEKPAPGPKRMYSKPSIRKTARAPEGEPLPIPGQKPEPRPAETPKAPPQPGAPPTPEGEAKKKKKKKKKKRSVEPEDQKSEMFEELAPKRRLRRKVAFKMQKGMEGMEVADIEKMYMPSRKKITGKKKPTKKTEVTTPKATKRVIRMGESIDSLELAKQMGVKSREIVNLLKKEGVPREETERLDYDTAAIVAAAYDYEIHQELFDEQDILGLEKGGPDGDKLKQRPPVVTVMGHVDHGKTSLLDTIRKTRVTEGEAGAITQHIGASVVETSSGSITFLDTPGHEAFTSMRMRGAKVTDIVVLVVAADDGIMPQTVEAANHAKAAGVPIIVAVNKIDLPQANPQNIMQRLGEVGLQAEEWGGDTQIVNCSAKTGEGVPDLLEAILLQAEVLELKAVPNGKAKGSVIESRLDKGRGPVATVLVLEGTLKKGDVVLAGANYGKIRAMLDDRGKQMKKAGPSQPVEIMGLSGVPEPGEEILAVNTEKNAKIVADHRAAQQRAEDIPQTPAKVSLEDLMAKLEEGEVEELNLIIKADTHGTTEAVKQSVEKLSTDEVRINVIHTGVGNITENDVTLASASEAVIIGFTVKAEVSARKLSEQEGVQIRTYDIIYHLIEDVEASLKGMLKPIYAENVLGHAEVRKIFRVSKVGVVAGSYVLDGAIKRNASARVMRNGDEVYTGKIKNLKRIQEDVREVAQGLECGISLENYNDFQEGDIVESFEMNEVAR